MCFLCDLCLAEPICYCRAATKHETRTGLQVPSMRWWRYDGLRTPKLATLSASVCQRRHVLHTLLVVLWKAVGLLRLAHAQLCHTTVVLQQWQYQPATTATAWSKDSWTIHSNHSPDQSKRKKVIRSSMSSMVETCRGAQSLQQCKYTYILYLITSYYYCIQLTPRCLDLTQTQESTRIDWWYFLPFPRHRLASSAFLGWPCKSTGPLC